MKIAVLATFLILTCKIAYAEPIYLDCTLSTDSETFLFSVKLDEETNKITHTDEDGSAFNEHRPDLILMDIQLPSISGLEATKRLKADETLKSLPVIAITAFAMAGDKEKILEGGCDAYLVKPISIPNFLQTVERFVRPLVAEREAV